MKKFFKGILTLFGIVATAIGALAIVDRLFNRNRIEGDYLDCTKEETKTEE